MKRFLLPFAAAAWATLLCVGPAAAAVIISEYVEGSSNNKAVELYNTSAVPVELSGYTLRIYFNGNSLAGASLPLAGSLAGGAAWVIAHPAAGTPLLETANQLSSALAFNGNDAIVLVLVLAPGETVVDSIGQVGVDPGAEWGTGSTSTRDNTLRRKSSVLMGDTDPSDAFEPSDQWVGYATDTFDGLGTHQVTAVPEPGLWLPFSAGLGLLAGGAWLRRRAIRRAGAGRSSSPARGWRTRRRCT